MLNTKCLSAVIVAALAVSSSAMADDRGVNTAVGAVLGAAIGHNSGGRDGAIVGGILGAAVGNAVSTRDDRRNSNAYYDNRGRYYAPAPVYVEARAYPPAPVYVESRGYAREEVYYAPSQVQYVSPPRYYQPPAVVYVEQGRGYGRHHGHWNERRAHYDERYDERGHGRW
jgi:hypothetical protein